MDWKPDSLWARMDCWTILGNDGWETWLSVASCVARCLILPSPGVANCCRQYWAKICQLQSEGNSLIFQLPDLLQSYWSDEFCLCFGLGKTCPCCKLMLYLTWLYHNPLPDLPSQSGRFPRPTSFFQVRRGACLDLDRFLASLLVA